MSDPSQVLEVLRCARGLVACNWASGNPDVPAFGSTCASVGIQVACFELGLDVPELAHKAVLSAAGIVLRDDQDPYATVYAWNDNQTDVSPVLAAFDLAIAKLSIESSDEPAHMAVENALAIIEACDHAGAVVAHQIVSERPDLDERKVASAAAAELFYAAQDTAQVCLASEVAR